MLFLAASALVLPVNAAPRKPIDDTDVLERLPSRAGDASSRELAAMRAAMKSAAGIQPRRPTLPKAISILPWRAETRASVVLHF